MRMRDVGVCMRISSVMKNSQMLNQIFVELQQQTKLVREIHAQVCTKKAAPKVEKTTKKSAPKVEKTKTTKKTTKSSAKQKAKKPVYSGFTMISSKIGGKLCLQSSDYTLRPFGGIMREFGGEFVAKLGFNKQEHLWGAWVFPTTQARKKAIEAIQSCK